MHQIQPFDELCVLPITLLIKNAPHTALHWSIF